LFRALHAAMPFYAVLVSAVYITKTTLHPTRSWIVSIIGICVITVVILDHRLQARSARRGRPLDEDGARIVVGGRWRTPPICTSRCLGDVERGVGNPEYATLLRLAHALNVAPGALVTRADELLKAQS